MDTKELRERLARATPGPYVAVMADGWPCVGRVNPDSSGGQGFLVAEGWELADCEYVAAAINALPALLDEVDSLREKNRVLTERIEVHHDRATAAEARAEGLERERNALAVALLLIRDSTYRDAVTLRAHADRTLTRYAAGDLSALNPPRGGGEEA